MKLESFLQESLDSIDISKFTDGVEPKSLATIKIILSKLKAYSKVSLEDVRVVEFLDNALKVASAFEDWYFEISGSVGKIKLIKITTDLEDGSSNNVWKWTPYAGQFWVDGDHIEARS